jgi:predicted Zn finger-like uncharacterized protein
MKFLCSNCKAKYQIADEKVAGRTLRMTCRQCKQEIVIRGDAPARASLAAPMPQPPPPSPLAADFQRQVGAGMRTSMPALPPLLDAWHVAINDVPVGPMRREDVARRVASGAVGPESLAWREGLDDWLPMRQIPELAALLGTSMPAPAPFVPALPAQRADVAPMGGRAGAAPAYSLEDWAPPSSAPESISALRSAPALGEREERERDRDRGGFRMSGGMMFVIACAFAFFMSVLTILGARWLSPAQPVANNQPPAVTVVNQQPAQAAQPDPEPTEMVIELDDIGLEGDPNRKPTTGKGATTTTTTKPKPKGPELTQAERDMIARMGGDPNTATIGGPKTGGTSRPSSGGSGEGLKGEQLSKVVMAGRKNLQRCYETALRGSGSDETIRLDVELTVSAAGNVTNVKTGDGGLPGMKECVQRTVKMWRFPSSGDSTTTKFPLVFQPGG